MEVLAVRPLRTNDVPAWQRLRKQLWPELADADNEHDSHQMLADGSRFAVFVSEARSRLVGFIEVSLRQYGEGCFTSPVGCIEGWYVKPAWRRHGVGRGLVAAAEDWARSKGCTEMASQALLHNIAGQHAHAHVGFSEVERQVCFRKDLLG